MNTQDNHKEVRDFLTRLFGGATDSNETTEGATCGSCSECSGCEETTEAATPEVNTPPEFSMFASLKIDASGELSHSFAKEVARAADVIAQKYKKLGLPFEFFTSLTANSSDRNFH